MSDLLPCPFCGSDGEVEIYDNRGTFVQCCGCFARAESMDAWNARQHDPLLVAQVVEALDGLIAVSEIAVMLDVMPMPHDANGPLPRAIEALSAYNERVKG